MAGERYEYQPWVELGITELAYWKKQYLELAQQLDEQEAVIAAARALHETDGPNATNTAIWEALDRLHEAVEALDKEEVVE